MKTIFESKQKVKGTREMFLSEKELLDAFGGNESKINDVNNKPYLSLGISNKGNFVITLKYIKRFPTKEFSQRKHERIEKMFDEAKTFREYQSAKNEVYYCTPRYFEDIKALEIFTKKLIICKDGIIYYIPKNNEIRRLSSSKKEHLEIISYFLNEYMDAHYQLESKKEITDIVYQYLLKAFPEISCENNLRNVVAYFSRGLRIDVNLIPKWVKKIKYNDVFLLYHLYSFLNDNGITNCEALKILANYFIKKGFYFGTAGIKNSMSYYKYLKEAYKNANVNVDLIFARRITEDINLVNDSLRLFKTYSQIAKKAIKNGKDYPLLNLKIRLIAVFYFFIKKHKLNGIHSRTL